MSDLDNPKLLFLNLKIIFLKKFIFFKYFLISFILLISFLFLGPSEKIYIVDFLLDHLLLENLKPP